MNNSFVTPRTAAIVGLLLVLPGALFLSLLMLGIEPPLGPLAPLLTTPPDGPNVVGTLVALTFILVLPLIGFALNLRPLLQSWQARSGLLTKPFNLV